MKAGPYPHLHLLLGMLVSLSVHSAAFAQQETNASADAQPSNETAPPEVGTKPNRSGEKSSLFDSQAVARTSKELREQSKYMALGSLSTLDLLVPFKLGVSVGALNNSTSLTEIEYLKGSLGVPLIISGLSDISDTRISLIQRSFAERNSFNFFFGLSYFAVEFSAGHFLLGQAVSSELASRDLVKVTNLGAVAGLGNRWHLTKNVVAGIDWFSWSQPLITLSRHADILETITDEGNKKTIEDALEIASYVPRITVLKLQIGASF